MRWLALYQAGRFVACQQGYYARAVGLQAFGQFASRGPVTAGIAIDVQQQELQGRNALACRILRKALEAAHLVTEAFCKNEEPLG